MSREYPDRPFVGIGIIVLKPDAVLLVRRGKAPNWGKWSLPGGAQELGETAEQAARRELLEETALSVGPIYLATNVDAIHHDEAGRIRFHYTIIDFAAAWVSGDPHPGDDVTDLRWGLLDKLNEYDLWSEAHRAIAIARTLLGHA